MALFDSAQSDSGSVEKREKSLLGRIESDLTIALKSGQTFERDALRFLKSVIQKVEIDSSAELTDEQIISIIQKEVKKRLEAENIYNQAEKPDLAQNEAAEAKILQQYLPNQLDEEGIKAVITEYLTANSTGIGQIGPAMGKLSVKLKGRADMGLVAKILGEQIHNR